MAVGQLGDMHEAFDAVFDGDEDTELNDLGDLALDDLARKVGAGEELLPPSKGKISVDWKNIYDDIRTWQANYTNKLSFGNTKTYII